MDLIFYLLIWGITFVIFMVSIIYNDNEIKKILNVISFIFWIFLGMQNYVTTNTILDVNGTATTVVTQLTGTYYLQLLAVLFLIISLLRGILYQYKIRKVDPRD